MTQTTGLTFVSPHVPSTTWAVTQIGRTGDGGRSRLRQTDTTHFKSLFEPRNPRLGRPRGQFSTGLQAI